MLLLPLYLFSVLITRMYEDKYDVPVSFDSGLRTSWRHCSWRDRLAISPWSVTALQICRWRVGTLFASCTVTVVQNMPVWPISPLPLKKKKLAPRRFFSKWFRATVCAFVD